ncbi:MAG: glutaredoxin 3 [Alphaproteobacteria bacterium]|nr:glutaredoxin 3 [Alphaproteobacteria bacterium]
MVNIEIYTSPLCGFCYRAKRLLDAKGVCYREIDVMFHPSEKGKMIDRAGGRRTVPQIFIDDTHVGGSDDLAALEQAGKLDQMLGLA